MQKFTTLTAIAAPLPMRNIDTDMIIPKQFLKTIKRTGLGKSLFHEMRYDPSGAEVADFVLNKPAYRKAEILITEPGYMFRHESDPVTDSPLSPTDTYGMHGYLKDHPAVHASYLAIGAGIEKGGAGTFRNTEVAGRVAEWRGIEKPRPRP